MEEYMKDYPKKQYKIEGELFAFFAIEEAWIWEIKEGYENIRPFKVLRELYARRRAIKDRIETRNKVIDEENKVRKKKGETELPYEYDITEKVLKLILNSVYGKLAQFVGSSKKVPNCANPYYAAAITAYCRRRLLEAALIDPRAIVFFATDGILATHPLHHLEKPIDGVFNPGASIGLKRVKDEKLGDEISLGDWEYARRDGGVFVMAGVYVHYLVERDEKGAFLFDTEGRPKVNAKYTGRLRGGDITKYAEGTDGQPWLVSNALAAWRTPYNLDDKTTYPAIESAYKKFVTAGSVLTPRYAPMLREGALVENNRAAAQKRYGLAGRWSPKADEPRNEPLKRMNADIKSWNEDIKVKAKWSYKDDKLKLGLIEEIEEIVFKRSIHVHDVGLKRVHNKSRKFGYIGDDKNEPTRCNTLIDTIPAGNLVKDDKGDYIFNWEMSAPRMPEWLNKDDEARTQDDELDIEVKAGMLSFDDDGENERAVDIYADT
jgi:hypothetical protein